MRPWLTVPRDGVRGVPIRFSSVYRCKCGYGQVWPRPSAREVAEFYDIPDYYTHGTVATQERPSFLDRLRVHLAWRADRPKVVEPEWYRCALPPWVRTVCDIGCGAGKIAIALKRAGYEVIGIEPDPAAASRLSTEIEVLSGTAEELPALILARRFDAIILRHVLEHCIDPVRVLKNVRKLLAPGGVLLCEVPNNEAIALKLSGPTWAMLDVPRHLNFFTAETLRGLMQKAGLYANAPEYAFYTRQLMNGRIMEERKLRAVTGCGPWNSRARAWLLLALSAYAPARYKYDSFRIIAVAL